MAMEAKNVELEDKIYRNKEKLGIENERLKVLEEEIAEIRKKFEPLKDMEARIVEIETESDRIKKELGFNIERQKDSENALAEFNKNVEAWKEKDLKRLEGARVALLECESNRHKEEMAELRKKVEVLKEMEIGDGDGE